MATPVIDPTLRHELRLSLDRVQRALEALPEYPEQRSDLLATLDRELRGLRGVFAIVDAFASERLAREMLAVVALPTLSDATCAALNDAALLLDASLDAAPDDTSLLPVLNALRTARGQGALSAAELFAARAQAEGWPNRVARTAHSVDAEAADALARRELAPFQTAFLAWFRNPSADDALARITAIASDIAAQTDDDRLRALWLGHAALADSLIGRNIDALDTRRLLGRAGSQLKALAEHGEAQAAIQTGDTQWLLVHALQAADTARARTLLAALLPDRPSPPPSAAAITPDRATRTAVLAALQVEFAAIKDAIDLRLRGSAGALADSAARLDRSATVIELLGHADAAATLHQQARALEAAQGSRDLAIWLPIAERLLRVESGLEAALLHRAPTHDDKTPHPQDQRDAATALIRELLIDVARLKSALERGLRETDTDASAALASLLHGLAGGLRLLGADAIADAASALEQYAASSAMQAADPPPAFAAAIVSLETWLEARRDDSPRGDALARALLASIDTLAIPAPGPEILDVPALAADTGSAEADAAELRALFLDEAAEVLAGLDALRPAFQRDPTRSDTLAAIRRAFHTLKGSGRTVGAEAIGNVGAAVETLLNRCLDGALTASRALVTVVDDAIHALPGLIDAWRDGASDADAGSRDLIVRAERVAAGPQASETDVRSVFCSDSRSRLAGIRDWLASRDRSAPAFAIDDSLSRSFHTLKGAAAIVNAVAMSRLAGLLETALDPQQHGRHELPVAALPLLDELVQQLAWWVEAVADDQPVPEEAADRYAARIASLHEQPVIEAVPEPAPEPIAERQPEPAFEAPIETMADPIVEAPASPPPEPTSLPALVVEADSDVDPELQDIFFGEAQELLEALAVSSSLWGGLADDARSLGSLRRGLHTLKGSARMAAATAIGAVAHRLETMLERPADHAPATLLAAFDTGLDALQRQLDALKAGERLPAAPVLAAIDAALGIASVAAVAVPAPVEAAAPPAWAPAPVVAIESESEPEAEPLAAAPEAFGAEARTAAASLGEWLPELFWTPDEAESAVPASRRETARVPVERLDAMLSQAGEIAIARARLDEHHAALKTQLGETTQTIARIREQLRQMDIETDAQISARSSNRAAVSHEPEDRYAAEFDALEMDRYSRMQELSRALAESVGDLGSLHGTMEEALGSAETLLQQQGRQTTELQQGLMGTLMVPFSRQEQRLTRVIRQTAHENGRDAEPVYIGTEAELDRNVLERMTAPLEHLLRNAVVHGIEPPEVRIAAGKPARGSIEIKLSRDGAQLLIEVGDDGRGLDYAAIRDKAIERGLISGRVELAREALARFIFEPRFSTASRLTQDAGRGIGMDVVANQVRQLGGTLELRSEPGHGARFIVRLPLALAVSQALLVGIGNDSFAIPLTSVEGVGRLPRERADALLAGNDARFRFADHDWHLRHLADFLDLPRSAAADSRHVNAVLIRLPGPGAGGERQLALVVDRVLGNREIVSKGAGPQLGSVAGIGGATILADGRVALILDLPTLVADHQRRALLAGGGDRVDARIGDARTTVLVVDDSITVRRVAERLLLRNGYRVLTARDGVDAMALLHTETPDAVLLDIEMPRADGFEVAAFIRKHARLSQLPIVMVTSRSGEKHRARARQLGVDGYLTKPWQDDQLLATLRTLPGIRQ